MAELEESRDEAGLCCILYFQFLLGLKYQLYICTYKSANTMPVLTRWLYCVECPQCSARLEVLGYLCTSCLLPAFDEA